jgi:hypothetical protein
MCGPPRKYEIYLATLLQGLKDTPVHAATTCINFSRVSGNWEFHDIVFSVSTVVTEWGHAVAHPVWCLSTSWMTDFRQKQGHPGYTYEMSTGRTCSGIEVAGA